MPAMTGSARPLALIVAISLGVALGAAWLLTGLFGPTERGLRCARAPVAQCEVLQTRLFGVAGNTSFLVAQGEIRAAKTLAPAAGHVGGRSGVGAYRVALLLGPGTPYPEYPVLSYDAESSADAATRRLNDYFADPQATSIEVMTDLLSPVLIAELSAMAVVVVLVLFLRRWRPPASNP
jgi:hypothetical protein